MIFNWETPLKSPEGREGYHQAGVFSSNLYVFQSMRRVSKPGHLKKINNLSTDLLIQIRSAEYTL